MGLEWVQVTNQGLHKGMRKMLLMPCMRCQMEVSICLFKLLLDFEELQDLVVTTGWLENQVNVLGFVPVVWQIMCEDIFRFTQ